MQLSDYEEGECYGDGWGCNLCEKDGHGWRWLCVHCFDDICLQCRPRGDAPYPKKAPRPSKKAEAAAILAHKQELLAGDRVKMVGSGRLDFSSGRVVCSDPGYEVQAGTTLFALNKTFAVKP